MIPILDQEFMIEYYNSEQYRNLLKKVNEDDIVIKIIKRFKQSIKKI